MNPIRRELLNGLLVLMVASLLSVAFSAFQVSFNAQLWVLILMGIAIAVGGYILFDITLRVITSAEEREKPGISKVNILKSAARASATLAKLAQSPLAGWNQNTWGAATSQLAVPIDVGCPMFESSHLNSLNQADVFIVRKN